MDFASQAKSTGAEGLMVSYGIIRVNHGKRKRLQRLARQTHNKIAYRRCQIILHLAQGHHPAVIASDLECHVCTVYRTRQTFVQTSERALYPKKSPGRPRKLTTQQVQQLDEALAHELRALGQNFCNWSVRQLLA